MVLLGLVLVGLSLIFFLPLGTVLSFLSLLGFSLFGFGVFIFRKREKDITT